MKQVSRLHTVGRLLVATLVSLCCAIAAAGDALPPDIGVVEMGAGRLFVDKQGFALYTYKLDDEQPGTSACVEDCAAAWPPVGVPQDPVSVGDWSVIKRPDGSAQWAHKAKPVYRHARDTHPGAINGANASGFWDVLFDPVATPPGIRLDATTAGQVLVDHEGRPLYTNLTEECRDACMEGWRPVEAPWLGQPINPAWSIARRHDGLAQWVFKSQPLFTYTGVNTATEHHASQGWRPVVLQPAPALPDWVTFQETDFGPVLADENRMTLYYIVSDPKEIALRTCNAACEKEHWKPVIAPPGTKPIGNWSTLQLADGSLQWVYLGRRVFTYRHDKLPGDINGDKFASGAAIRDGWHAILKETLIQKLF